MMEIYIHVYMRGINKVRPDALPLSEDKRTSPVKTKHLYNIQTTSAQCPYDFSPAL